MADNGNRICSQCGSELILIEQNTSNSETVFTQITKVTYRCSNTECQDGIDKRVKEAMQRRKDQELAKAQRLSARSSR